MLAGNLTIVVQRFYESQRIVKKAISKKKKVFLQK